MTTEKFICAMCKQHLHISLSDVEVFVKNRIFGLTHKKELHHCGFEGIFEDNIPYVAFLYLPNDPSTELLAQYGFNKWNGKVEFFDTSIGIEKKSYFKKILRELLNETDSILKLPNLQHKEDKIKKLIEDKFSISK